MTSKKISDFVQTWTSKIDQGLEYRTKFSSYNDWPSYRDYYRGNWGPNVKRPCNRIYSNIKALIPQVYFRTPSVVVTPLREEYSQTSRIVEAVDNWLIRELALKYTIKRTIPDTSICGTGVIKLGYDSEFGYIPQQAVLSDGETMTQVDRKGKGQIEYNVNIKPGMPWAVRVRPDDLVTPYGYDSIESFPWICHMIIRPLKDIQGDQKYRNTENLKGGYVPDTSHPLIKARRAMMTNWKDDDYCLIYEIRDAVTKRVYAICEDEVLLDVKDELQIEGLPFEIMCFNEDTDYFWGISDVKMILPQIEELNEIGNQSSAQRAFSLLKFLYQKGTIKQEQLDKLLSNDSSDAGCGIEIESESLPASVLPLQPHSLLNDISQDRAEVESQIRETFGFSRNQVGEFFPKTSKTATEAQIVQSAAQTRVDERRDHVADVVERIIRKWNQYIFKFWTSNRAIQIVGPEGSEWVSFTGEQLAGEYNIRIDVESGLPMSKGMKFQTARELYGMLRQDPFIDQFALRAQLLRQFEWVDPGLKHLLTDPRLQAMKGTPIFPPDGGRQNSGAPQTSHGGKRIAPPEQIESPGVQ